MDCCRVMAPKPQQKTKELVEGGVRIPGWVVSDFSPLSSIFIFCKLQHLVLFLNPSATMLWAWCKRCKTLSFRMQKPNWHCKDFWQKVVTTLDSGLKTTPNKKQTGSVFIFAPHGLKTKDHEIKSYRWCPQSCTTNFTKAELPTTHGREGPHLHIETIEIQDLSGKNGSVNMSNSSFWSVEIDSVFGAKLGWPIHTHWKKTRMLGNFNMSRFEYLLGLTTFFKTNIWYCYKASVTKGNPWSESQLLHLSSSGKIRSPFFWWVVPAVFLD